MEFNVGSRKVQIKRWLQRFILHFKRKEIRLQISGRLVKSIINTLSRIHKYHSTLRKTKQIWRFTMNFRMIYILAEKHEYLRISHRQEKIWYYTILSNPKKHISVRNSVPRPHHEISFLPFQAFRHYKNRLSRKGFRINTINFSLRFFWNYKYFLRGP